MVGMRRLRELYHRFRGRILEFGLQPYERILKRINEREADLRRAADAELAAMSASLGQRGGAGAGLPDLVPDTFALVREAARRTLGLRPFDVQVIGGLVIYQGKLAEMQTGEGKTLAAVAPAYLQALAGRGVHVLTFNDYLARRDAKWMGPIYRFLGLSVGFVQQGMSIAERQSAYRADVTYVTAKEAGFDSLRDHLCTEPGQLVHRPFHFAIIDEADSILIDEARVPLVIAGNAAEPPKSPHAVAEIVRRLGPGIDFDTDEYARNVNLTETGLTRLEALIGCGNLHDPENLRILTELNLALQALVLLKRDRDYIVRDGEVKIVDELTGRVVEDRRWPYGLHTAVEAKEGLTLQPDGEIRGSIALQHFLQLYPRIGAMTATAQPATEELNEFYNLKVVVIPANRPCIRVDHPDLVFPHKAAKQNALLDEIGKVHATGRPILVGTGSVEESESLAAALSQRAVRCVVLNAKNDAAEAKIIAQAGAPVGVTISTNMAGRGVDIRLGGESGQGRAHVVALGGLYVIGTNRHESRRIDNQLRGRAGRQGDPGESRFFISLEDDLIQRYGVLELIPPRHRPSPQDRPVDDPVVRLEIERAQRIIDGQNHDIRRTLRRYSSLVEEQRRNVHQRRQAVLCDAAPLRLLEAKSPQRYAALRARVTDAVLRRVEKQLTLFHIDECWTEHLARVAHIRDGIHLFSIGGYDPLDEFHKAVAKAFQGLLEKIDHEIVDTFERAEITQAGIDLDKLGLRGPGSTWTYLVSDNPFGSWLDRAFKGLRAKLRKVPPER
jgi:preprotein translocase subunit SecA